MSLAAQLEALANRIGSEIKGLIRPEHPGLARAWICFGWVDGTMQIRAAHNVAGVTRLAAGRYRISFATPFPDANYCWVATARSNTDSSTQRMALIRATTEDKTADYVEVICASAGGSRADTTELNLVVYR